MKSLPMRGLFALSSVILLGGVGIIPAQAVGDTGFYQDKFDAQVQSVNASDPATINVHLMYTHRIKPGQSAPTILLGPGFGSKGSKNRAEQSNDAFGMVGPAPLLEAGYNVVTWDPRGFGKSSGDVAVNNPGLEGLDAKAVVDWLVEQPGIALETPKPGVNGKDPVLGMASGSYGGGIQWILAALDKRVDAITPAISWHSLETSLLPSGSLRQGWGIGLCAMGGMGVMDATMRQILPQKASNRAFQGQLRTACLDILEGKYTQKSKEYLQKVGPGNLIEQVRIPTLIIQGTVDTLFPLAQADANAKILAKNGVEHKVLWFCGGHGICTTGYHHKNLVTHSVLQWFDKHLRGQDYTDAKFAASQFIFPDQFSSQYGAPSYPAPLNINEDRPDGLIHAKNDRGGLMLVSPAATSGMIMAAGAAIVSVDAVFEGGRNGAMIAGTPHLEFEYQGRDLIAANRQTFLYAQLVDPSIGHKVWGNIATAIPVILDGKKRKASLDLGLVAGELRPGAKIILQITPHSALSVGQKSTAFTRISKVKATLPSVMVEQVF